MKTVIGAVGFGLLLVTLACAPEKRRTEVVYQDGPTRAGADAGDTNNDDAARCDATVYYCEEPTPALLAACRTVSDSCDALPWSKELYDKSLAKAQTQPTDAKTLPGTDPAPEKSDGPQKVCSSSLASSSVYDAPNGSKLESKLLATDKWPLVKTQTVDAVEWAQLNNSGQMVWTKMSMLKCTG